MDLKNSEENYSKTKKFTRMIILKHGKNRESNQKVNEERKKLRERERKRNKFDYLFSDSTSAVHSPLTSCLR